MRGITFPDGRARMDELHRLKERLAAAENKLREQERFLADLIENSGALMFIKDIDGVYRFVNSKWEEITGCRREEVLGKTDADLFPPEAAAHFCRHDAEVLRSGEFMEFEELFDRPDGRHYYLSGKFPMRAEDGVLTGLCGVIVDITELKRQRQEIEFLSFHDHLTGLYNRRFFDEEFARLDSAGNFPLTLLLMDVNGLKLINDAFGHRVGDILLRTVADVLRRTCRGGEIIARIGGDEFAVLLPRTDEDGASALRMRISDAFEAERTPAGSPSVAFGQATKSAGDGSVEELVANAENRMYQEKIRKRELVRGQAISFILRSLFEKIPREREHSERVAELAERMGRAMGMSAEDVGALLTAAKLHDIGKIAVSDILDKTEPLQEGEWFAVKRHSEIGYAILNSGGDFAVSARIVLAHHERFDGKGYPKGLEGRAIPLHARIIAVADAYDAMTSGRPYRPARTPSEALDEIEAGSGTQFDPEVVRVFMMLFETASECSNG